MLPLERFTFLKSLNVDFIDSVFEQYLTDPESVDPSWKYLFEGIELGTSEGSSPTHSVTTSVTSQASNNTEKQIVPNSAWEIELKAFQLIEAYRAYGKLSANTNPLFKNETLSPFLDPSLYGIHSADFSKNSVLAGKFLNQPSASLQVLIQKLKSIYCRSIGIEISHIQSKEIRDWFQEKFENPSSSFNQSLDAETRKYILKRLSDSETFERFLHTRYVAQKRFSIEGGESAIPCLDAIIETAAQFGAEDIIIGMAHRGRLNVLTNIMGKKTEHMFVEFEGTYPIDPNDGEGDVKYHKGYSRDFTTRQNRNLHLSLAANPSHLEFINPAVVGSARAKFDRKRRKNSDAKLNTVIPIQIHGDAAFAGQGICYETLSMSKLPAYHAGGSIHLIINNQIGFTTFPHDSRSTQYCSDLAKFIDSPIFHVNGDDPEAVWKVATLCTEYRQRFGQSIGGDVVIDLVCYRKYGHNEGDEPSFTQPLLYKTIKAQPSTRELYSQKLISEKVLSHDEAQHFIERLIERFTEAQKIAKTQNPKPAVSIFEGSWKGLRKGTIEDNFKPVKTQLSKDNLLQLAVKMNSIPNTFKLHSKLTRFFEARLKSIQEGKGIDWGNAEGLAFASLLDSGIGVRITGQDAERGTFTHRHCVITDFETGNKYSPYEHLHEKQGQFTVCNSLLSEAAVLGFEYGYTLAEPNSLTIWEGQFGDFANGAQVIIDQFIATSETKWQRASGLTLLLPHGYEGQGPEHSSARLERFLTLCGQNNMIVCNISTPANIFHALRRQVLRDYRKPLIVMSPKSLLRHPLAVSPIEDFTQQGFQEVIVDSTVKASAVKRLLLCSGKVYYDLFQERENLKRNDVAIVRVEQLYPWPAEMLAKEIKKYNALQDIVWVQEEPKNMGAWPFVFATWAGGLDQFHSMIGNQSIRYAGRDIAAAPAVGAPRVHEQQLKAFLAAAFKE